MGGLVLVRLGLFVVSVSEEKGVIRSADRVPLKTLFTCYELENIAKGKDFCAEESNKSHHVVKNEIDVSKCANFERSW